MPFGKYQWQRRTIFDLQQEKGITAPPRLYNPGSSIILICSASHDPSFSSTLALKIFNFSHTNRHAAECFPTTSKNYCNHCKSSHIAAESLSASTNHTNAISVQTDQPTSISTTYPDVHTYDGTVAYRCMECGARFDSDDAFMSYRIQGYQRCDYGRMFSNKQSLTLQEMGCTK
ncbi:hypothetical protein IQ06DRAFT_20571 [Phaeosphaeriaceae sp. SRC1lsM3a]|nr:hypothetical protein IQ06DRAFT_20571 [Stagonospora sp. SRC1lsM3a]